MTGKAVRREQIGFPIIDTGAGTAAAVAAMRAYHIGGAAVAVGNTYALVRARDILDSVPRDKSLAAIAATIHAGPDKERIFAQTGPAEKGGLLFVDPDKVALNLFEVPAAYKQCSLNHDHIFDADLDAHKCPTNDGGDLTLVF